jgi:trk system potassium uptake protein TrkA
MFPLRPSSLEIFQVNFGKMCNQVCSHCHVDAGPDRTEIMSRATMELILQKIGLKEILTPEDEVAYVVREKLINPSIVSYLQLPDDYEIAEIVAPKGCIGRALDEIEFRNKYELTLVTIKRQYEVDKNGQHSTEQHVIGVPKSDTTVIENDTLVVFGTAKSVQRFMDINLA